MTFIVQGVAVALLVIGIGLAVSVRQTPTEGRHSRPYRRPIVGVLAGMVFGLLTIVPSEGPNVGALLVGSLSLLALAVVAAIAITDPNHAPPPPWQRGPV